MRIFITSFSLIFCFLCASAQPKQHLLSDTLLKEQKENVITASTIIQVENLGEDINTYHP